MCLRLTQNIQKDTFYNILYSYCSLFAQLWVTFLETIYQKVYFDQTSLVFKCLVLFVQSDYYVWMYWSHWVTYYVSYVIKNGQIAFVWMKAKKEMKITKQIYAEFQIFYFSLNSVSSFRLLSFGICCVNTTLNLFR